MKLRFFLIVLILACAALHGSAQITILDSDMLKLGDTVRISETTDANIDYTTTGPNSEWDFSYLQAESQFLIDPYNPQAAGFLVNNFFGANAGIYAAEYYRSLELPLDQAGQFLPVNIEDAFRFSRITEDSLTYIGIAIEVEGNTVPVRSDTIEKVYDFPMNYQDQYNSRGYTNADFNPFFDGIFRQYRQRETEVDGYGTVITPLGTYECLRVHHRINEFDSLYVGLGLDTWIPLDLPVRHVYEWWAKDELYPVIRIEVQEINGDEVVSDILYQDIYLGLDASLTTLSSNEYNFFPNPVSEKLTLQTKGSIQHIKIFNLNGELVHEQQGNLLSEITIDVNTLEEGVYFMHFETDLGVAKEKFLKF
jgi:hypothetical protein